LRSLDDLVDGGHADATERVEAVEDWVHGKHSDSPEVDVLRELTSRTGLRVGPFEDFCAAMRRDLAGATVASEADLERYCEQAGGSVGRMLAQLLGSADPRCELRMAALGRAVQRTNILRDIDEDLTAGRVYIARTTIDRFGWPTPGHREQLLRDQIPRADRLFREGRAAIPLLSRGAQFVAVSTRLYQEILRQIEREGLGEQAGRVVVPRWRQRLVVARERLRSPAPRLGAGVGL
jgi:phytoene synthase